jgi:hypothetical protein
MLIALLIYSYINGAVFQLQAVKFAYDSIAFRHICANKKADHTTIARAGNDL